MHLPNQSQPILRKGSYILASKQIRPSDEESEDMDEGMDEGMDEDSGDGEGEE